MAQNFEGGGASLPIGPIGEILAIINAIVLTVLYSAFLIFCAVRIVIAIV